MYEDTNQLVLKLELPVIARPSIIASVHQRWPKAPILQVVQRAGEVSSAAGLVDATTTADPRE